MDLNWQESSIAEMPADLEARARTALRALAEKLQCRAGTIARVSFPNEPGRSSAAVLVVELAQGPTAAPDHHLVLKSDSNATPDRRGVSLDTPSEFMERLRERGLANIMTQLYSLPEIAGFRIFYHAAGRTGKSMRTLSTFISGPGAANHPVPRTLLQTVLTQLVFATSRLEAQKQITTGEYVHSIDLRTRLAPDFIIETSGLQGTLSRNSLVVLPQGVSHDPAKLRQGLSLYDDVAPPSQIGQIYCTFAGYRRPNPDTTYLLLLHHDEMIQVGISTAALPPADEMPKVGDAISFVYPTPCVRESVSWFSDEFDANALLTFKTLKSLVDLKFLVNIWERHGDLHGGNVLINDLDVIIIDFDSVCGELFWTDLARLETSCWYCPDDETASEAEREAAQAIILPPRDSAISESSARLQAIAAIWDAGRAASSKMEFSASELETLLAYLVQVALYQRYWLDERISDIHIERPTFVAHCHRVLTAWRALTSNQEIVPGSDTLPIKKPCVSGAVHEDPCRTTKHLHDLVKEAFQDYHGTLVYQARRFCGSFTTSTSRSGLTELQQAFMQLISESRDGDEAKFFAKNPVWSDANVIITGPTSSGKTTIADIFLFFPTLHNVRRVNAIYIAPTKALTNEKYNDLVRLASSLGSLAEDVSICISTGDDTQDDRRLAVGDFSIACVVYEKANILFSRTGRVLDRVGIVVVDELHMLGDLERGPVLETVLAKVLEARQTDEEQATIEDRPERLRTVVISTEGIPRTGFETWLSVDRSAFHAGTVPPIVITTDQRPTRVEHGLVLPAASEKVPFTYVPITQLKGDSNRRLSPDEIESIEGDANDVFRDVKAFFTTEGGTTYLASHANHRTQVLDFVLDYLSTSPRGARLLVFVRGRESAERHADDLASARSLSEQSAPDGGRSRQLADSFGHAEEPTLVASLASWTKRKVFVHHSDLHPAIRKEVEQYCRAPVADCEPSEVLFATQTLSYGVNLAISDVLLEGYWFQASNRSAPPRPRPLDPCEWHNMLGRAARFGKPTLRPSRALVSCHFGKTGTPNFISDILRRYYRDVSMTNSRLFVTNDCAAVRNISMDDAEVTLSISSSEAAARVEKFSQPFLRAVLEALRHLNFREGASESRSSSIEELLTFMRYTYFDHENKENLNLIALRDIALRASLIGMAQRPFELLKSNLGYDRFTITERGDAILNTGTDIRSIKPFIDMISLVAEIWKRYCNQGAKREGEVPIPVELFLFCVLAQDEVVEVWLKYVPESRFSAKSDEAIKINREALRISLCGELNSIVEQKERVTSAGAAGLVEEAFGVFEANLPDALISGIPDRRIATQALMRVFLFTLMWLRGESRNRMGAVLRSLSTGAAERAPRFRGLPQFVEKLAYSVSFVETLVRTEPSFPEEWRSGRSLNAFVVLAQRLRYGCGVDALPYFWSPQVQLQRLAVIDVVKEGFTPGRMLTSRIGRFPEKTLRMTVEEAKAHLVSWLCNGVSSFSFAMTVNERLGLTGEPARLRLADLWTFFERSMRHNIDWYRNNEGEYIEKAEKPEAILIPADSNPTRVEVGGEGIDDALRVQLARVDEYGFILALESISEEGRLKMEVRFVFARTVESGGICLDGGVPVDTDLIRKIEIKTDLIVFVAGPFLNTRHSSFIEQFKKDMKYRRRPVRFISLGAFLWSLSLIIRGLVDYDTISSLFEKTENLSLEKVIDQLVGPRIPFQVVEAATNFTEIWEVFDN